MGYLKSLGTGFVWICTFLAAITFIPGLPPNVEFSPYSFKAPAALNNKPNTLLNGAEKLFEGTIKGPECFDTYNGALYTTLHGGALGVLKGNKLEEVARFGKKCDGLWEEEKCGRPLGLKIDRNGNAYVVDTYYGIYKVNVNTGRYERLVDTSLPIEGKVSMTPNSIDVAQNGDFYWTVSSTQYKLYDGVFALLNNPSGRLIRYNAATKKNEVLLEDLGFANGIKLSEDESFLIVAETMTSRIIKYYLKGPKAGKSEVFIEGLPGLPDNIHSDGQGNFLVALFTTADEENPSLTQSLAPHPNLRKMMVRFLHLIETPFKFLTDAHPNYYSTRIVHWIGHFESVTFTLPKSVTVLRISPAGKVLNVLQSSDESISEISSAFPLGDYLWLGSPMNSYLARVPLDKVLPDLKIKKEQPKVIKKQVVEKTVPKKVPSTTTPKPETTTPKPSTTTSAPKTAPPPPPAQKPRPSPADQKPKEAKAKVEPVKKPSLQTKPTKPPKAAVTDNLKPVKERPVDSEPTKPVVRDEM